VKISAIRGEKIPPAPPDAMELRTRALWLPPDKLSADRWVELHVSAPMTSHIPGPLKMSNAPWIREPLNVCDDPAFREVWMRARRERIAIVATVIMANDSIMVVRFGPRGGWSVG